MLLTFAAENGKRPMLKEVPQPLVVAFLFAGRLFPCGKVRGIRTQGVPDVRIQEG